MLTTSSLFDERVLLVIEPIGEPDVDALLPQERAVVAKAVAKRVREFAAGRLLARRLLEDAGIVCGPLLRGEHGAVRWPSNVQASISHSGSWVGVALCADATQAGLGGIGLDIEDAKPLDERYWHVILTQEDMAHLDGWPPGERPQIAKAIFCAKEAAYKAQYPRSTTFLPFSAMHVAVDPSREHFTATFRTDAPTFVRGDVIEGRFAWAQDMLVASATVST